MIIVREEDQAQQALDAGKLACSRAGCAGLVRRDGHARSRWVRTRSGHKQVLRPQRVRCRRCERVQVLLPAWCVPRRADDTETIGVALLHAALGRGHRMIAVMLGRPASTVRGWLRAARSNADRTDRYAYLLRRHLESTHPARSAPHARTPLAYAVAELGAAAAAAHRHFGVLGPRHSPWAMLTFVGGFLLLAPPRFSAAFPPTH